MVGFFRTGCASASVIARACLTLASGRPHSPSRRAGFRAVDSLFRRFAVEMFVVGLRVAGSMVDDAVPMIRRRIDRIELQWNIAGIDDVVIDPSRDDYGEARSDRRPNAIEHRLTGSHLHA